MRIKKIKTMEEKLGKATNLISQMASLKAREKREIDKLAEQTMKETQDVLRMLLKQNS
jgi:hypothetical protein